MSKSYIDFMLKDTIKGGQEETKYRSGQEETKYRSGQEETKYRSGQEETKYRSGQEEPKYRAGQEETKYRAGQEETKYRAGQEETKYRAGQEETKYRSGQEETKYRAGQEETKYRYGQEEPKYITRGGVRTMTKSSDIASTIFRYKNQMQIYHWQTKSFARHKGSDVMLEGLDNFLDTFMEAYMGKYGRPDFGEGVSIVMMNIDDMQVLVFLEEMSNYFNNELGKYLDEKDTDLFNIRDEILGVVNKVKYLFTLN